MLSSNALNRYSEFFNLDFNEKLTKSKHKKQDNLELWIADIHAPYHDRNLLGTVLEDNLDCKNLVIAGDFFDMYSKSHYRKTKDISFRAEFREAYYLLKTICANFDNVYLMLTNHDERFRKWLFDNLPYEALEFVNQDLVEDLLKLIPNLKIIKHKLVKRELGYIVQLRNTVFCHIEKSAKDVSKVVQEINKDLHRWQSIFNLKPFDILVQAHNHQSAKIKFDSKWLYQIPCLIDENEIAFDYVFSGKLQGNPPAKGYIVAHIENELYNPVKTNIIDL